MQTGMYPKGEESANSCNHQSYYEKRSIISAEMPAIHWIIMEMRKCCKIVREIKDVVAEDMEECLKMHETVAPEVLAPTIGKKSQVQESAFQKDETEGERSRV
ncbi:hypothetical protein Tco_0030987 [Tanacetum coccineum]